MATVLNRPERQVNLRVSWATYERLLAEHEENSSIRFTYNKGELEILVPSAEHEMLTSKIEDIVQILADEAGLDFERTRSNTFWREDLEKGFEPDSSFYFQSAHRIRGKKRIDLRRDPPPDLVVEVEVTNESTPKLPISLALQAPEVWRYSKGTLRMFVLTGKIYVESAHSGIFPNIQASAISGLIASSLKLSRPVWLKRVRDSARSNH